MSTSAGVARDRIFISYRRDDACGASGRVWDWLRIGFGRERVFRDVASIGAGKWRQKIEEALGASKACVAVIGRRWADETNLPRLQDPSDMVRHELEMALASGEREDLTVIPLLVEDAQLRDIPKSQLPESLRPLLGDWNVLALSESGWDEDTRRLIEAIAAATGMLVNPELEDWMTLMSGAQQGLNRMQDYIQLDFDIVQSGVGTLDALLHQAAESELAEQPAIRAALAAMEAGDTLLAEQSFEQELDNRRCLRLTAEPLVPEATQFAAEERKREADAANNVGILAVMRGDLEKASAYFDLALQANPEDLETEFKLGMVLIRGGKPEKAKDTFLNMLDKARALDDQWQMGRTLHQLGNVYIVLGDYGRALKSFMSSLIIAETFAKLYPGDTQYQLILFYTQKKVAEVL